MEQDGIKIMTIKDMIERYPEVRICQEILAEQLPGWELISPTCPGRQGYETWGIKRGDERNIVSFHLSTRTMLNEGELRGKKKPERANGDDADVRRP